MLSVDGLNLSTPYVDEEPVNRPAPQQIQASDLESTQQVEAEGHAYNIWTNRWIKHDWNPSSNKVFVNEYCLNLETDCGCTEGFKRRGQRFLCINFARGRCYKGDKCTYLHYPPFASFFTRIPRERDVFGRRRHLEDADIASAVGSMRRDCKTVAFINIDTKNKSFTDKLVRFCSKFAAIVGYTMNTELGVMFLTAESRIQAEFLKVAVRGQKLPTTKFIIEARWPTIGEAGYIHDDLYDSMGKQEVEEEFYERGEPRRKKQAIQRKKGPSAATKAYIDALSFVPDM
ncbi:hypothetical protein PCE1_000135 [Barthelona sp. PCE]